MRRVAPKGLKKNRRTADTHTHTHMLVENTGRGHAAAAQVEDQVWNAGRVARWLRGLEDVDWRHLAANIEDFSRRGGAVKATGSRMRHYSPAIPKNNHNPHETPC